MKILLIVLGVIYFLQFIAFVLSFIAYIYISTRISKQKFF